jgi:hypothetical protein
MSFIFRILLLIIVFITLCSTNNNANCSPKYESKGKIRKTIDSFYYYNSYDEYRLTVCTNFLRDSIWDYYIDNIKRYSIVYDSNGRILNIIFYNSYLDNDLFIEKDSTVCEYFIKVDNIYVPTIKR